MKLEGKGNETFTSIFALENSTHNRSQTRMLSSAYFLGNHGSVPNPCFNLHDTSNDLRLNPKFKNYGRISSVEEQRSFTIGQVGIILARGITMHLRSAGNLTRQF